MQIIPIHRVINNSYQIPIHILPYGVWEGLVLAPCSGMPNIDMRLALQCMIIRTKTKTKKNKTTHEWPLSEHNRNIRTHNERKIYRSIKKQGIGIVKPDPRNQSLFPVNLCPIQSEEKISNAS